MPEQRYPTSDEFWKRLRVRNTENDLQEVLLTRTRREEAHIGRAGPEPILVAVAKRLLPDAAVPARALAAFLDETFDRQLGRGDDKAGVMPRGELIPAGFLALDDAGRERFGSPFAELAPAEQDELLGEAERGELEGPERFDSTTWFKRVRSLLLLGFGSDPRGMVRMGFPGPSYMPGHVWLDEEEVKSRAGRKIGYLEL
jgi:Gluconate 2-dehydrogenase subunit 3